MSDPGNAIVAEGAPSSLPHARMAPDGSLLQSTPSNRGLSAASKQLKIHGVGKVALTPWVMEDVCKAKECEADEMLKYLLWHASKKLNGAYTLDEHVLLDRCLSAHIMKCTLETNLYVPFVKASNTALTCLNGLKIDGMREWGSDQVQMFFQCNDPNVIPQDHAGHTSGRKPNVVILPFMNDSDYFAEARLGHWDDHVGSLDSKAPMPTHWKDVLSVFEFKRVSSMNPPPETYSLSEYKAPKRKFLKIGKDGKELDEGPAKEPQQVPVSEQAKLAELAPPCRSTRKATRSNTQAKSRSSLKCRSEADSDTRSSKRTKTEQSEPHATVQTAFYAVEMLSVNIAVKYVVNFIVIGDEIWIRYYDRQGLISVGGFNFVQDLPWFLVLLYVLQRFQLEDWGRNTEFKPTLKGDDIKYHTVKVDGKELTLDNEERVTPFCLGGHGTDVMDVICEKLKREKPADEMEGGMIAKLYWAEETWVSEEDILKHVKRVAEQDEAVRGHVPTLLLSKKFTGLSTSTVRKALGLKDPTKGSRTLFLLIFKKLSPIKELQNDELWDAWRQCVLCHYVLWKAGIHHRDVSCENLMYYRFKGKVIGVLNDYDLASLTTSNNPLGYERTGMIPFMVIDLLNANTRDGKVEHLYCHDMVSFIWVFVWICFQYEDGKLRVQGPLDAWAKVDASGCAEKKKSFLLTGEVPPDMHNEKYVVALVHFLHTEVISRYGIRLALRGAKSQFDGDLSDATLDASQITSDLEEFLDKSSMLPPSSLAQSPTHDVHHPDGENASRPSDGWLRNPAWIDGGVNPPCFYISHQEIEETRAVACQHVPAPPVLLPPLPPHDMVTPPMTTQAGAIIPVVLPQIETDGGQNVPVSNMPVGHLVSATMVYLSTEKPTSSHGKPTVKKLCTTKSDQISIDDISHVDFVKAFLQIHELTDQYSPGVHFGPQFKLWWTGSSGGKAGASTIENDHDFSGAML
ncbi:hypothetical protein BU15DRAFT_71167 [Melanogaster broomeanus]|nr:hypothetical protein BU15DRAFT_71167 [Melanogaster broomeanus]